MLTGPFGLDMCTHLKPGVTAGKPHISLGHDRHTPLVGFDLAEHQGLCKQHPALSRCHHSAPSYLTVCTDFLN